MAGASPATTIPVAVYSSGWACPSHIRHLELNAKILRAPGNKCEPQIKPRQSLGFICGSHLYVLDVPPHTE